MFLVSLLEVAEAEPLSFLAFPGTHCFLWASSASGPGWRRRSDLKNAWPGAHF